jgi:FlaA1/EpsC-like NDP-sugar epimerase
MTIPEACHLVLEASVMAEGGEIFVFDMGKPVKILDLARNMIQLAGLVPDVDIEIKFVGLRPGEKLYEDLFSANAEMKDTYHEKIMISKEPSKNAAEAKNIIEKLQSLEGFYDPELYQMIIKSLLPEYQNNLAGSKQITFQAVSNN